MTRVISTRLTLVLMDIAFSTVAAVAQARPLRLKPGPAEAETRKNRWT